jgi:transposase
MSITNCSIERLDHLGIVAGVIKDLKIIELIDDKLGTYEGESLSAGETVAGMIINGLGFSNKPMSLTPLFFEHIPLELLFREGVKADDFNRFKLGRVLDRCHGYGTELLFSKIALKVCQQEKVDTRFNSTDTTSFVLTGDYLGKADEDTVKIKLGYSKDHRPDLKQVMLEMMVSMAEFPCLARR